MAEHERPAERAQQAGPASGEAVPVTEAPPAEIRADDLVARTDLLAAALRRDAADLAVYARVLTDTLAGALPPGTVEVERERSLGDRLRGREGTVAGVHVRLGDTALTLRDARGEPVGEVVREVRGVVLSRQTVPLDEWLLTLARGIAEAADRTARGREALQRFLLGPEG